jgi:hypothetical protein
MTEGRDCKNGGCILAHTRINISLYWDLPEARKWGRLDLSVLAGLYE